MEEEREQERAQLKKERENERNQLNNTIASLTRFHSPPQRNLPASSNEMFFLCCVVYSVNEVLKSGLQRVKGEFAVICETMKTVKTDVTEQRVNLPSLFDSLHKTFLKKVDKQSKNRVRSIRVG
jgi:hypothetical protein